MGHADPMPPPDPAQRARLSRAEFLRGALAAAAAASLGPRLLAGRALAAVDPSLSPLELDFSIVERFRPFDLLPARFREIDEKLGEPGTSVRYAGSGMQADGQAAELGPADAALRLRSSAAAPTLLRTAAGPVAPYAAVIVEAGRLAPASGGEAVVVAGLVQDARNYVVVSLATGGAGTATLAVDVAVDGKVTRPAAKAADLPAPARFAFALNENYVTALLDGPGGWSPVVRARVTDLVDLRDPNVLRAFRYGFGGGGAGSEVDLGALQAGYFGEVGLRDLHVVSYADGAPYVRDGKLYFTATQAGLAFFPAAHWGVWTLDLQDLRRIEPVAKLFFARDGLVLGDHAGQIVLDERDGGFHVAVSAWGDFDFRGIHVRYARSFADVLHGVHVLESAKLELPTDLGAWDPALARIDGSWHVGFAESPYQDRVRGFDFHPALARGEPGGALDRLSRVGADLTRHQTEGTILQKVGGSWYLFASDGAERKYRVYDLAMNFLGVLDAPYGTNIPHPQIVPVADGDRTSYLLLTFDGMPYHEATLGYGTHGDFILMRARQTVEGHEFTPRN